MPVSIPSDGCPCAGREDRVREQQSARSDRSELEVLDAISVSPVPDGPFGQDLRYGRPGWWVNALIHEVRRTGRRSIHEFTADVDGPWITPLTRLIVSVRQPPIANISIRGRSPVAAVRSSE
jgi:hypothetical protein